MEALALHAFVTLFVVIGPVDVAPFFSGLTHGMDHAQRRAMALRSTSVAALILIAFALVGEWLLAALGIGLPAFRIAGGILLLLVAIDMVFARKSGVRLPTNLEEEEALHKDDISVFPLAFPLIAGPGAMTSVLLLAGRTDGDPFLLGALLAVLLAVLALTLVAMLIAGRIMGLLGATGVNVVGRVLGVILAALAAQYVLDGLSAVF